MKRHSYDPGAGDPDKRNEIINRIIKAHCIMITAICARMIPGSTYKDAVQDFSAKFCNFSIEKLEEIEKRGSKYIYGMCTNHCIDIIRKQKTADAVITDSIGLDIDTRAQGITGEGERLIQMIDAIEKELIATYDENTAIIITMKIKGFSSKEISKRTGIKPGTIDGQIHRLRKDPVFIRIIKNIIIS